MPPPAWSRVVALTYSPGAPAGILHLSSPCAALTALGRRAASARCFALSDDMRGSHNRTSFAVDSKEGPRKMDPHETVHARWPAGRSGADPHPPPAVMRVCNGSFIFYLGGPRPSEGVGGGPLTERSENFRPGVRGARRSQRRSRGARQCVCVFL